MIHASLGMKPYLVTQRVDALDVFNVFCVVTEASAYE